MLGDGYIYRYILGWLRRHGFHRNKKDNWWIRNLAEKAMTKNIEALTAARIAAARIALARQPWRLPELCDPETLNMMEKLGVKLNTDNEYIYERTVEYVIDKLLYHYGILPSEKHYLYNEAMKYKFLGEKPWIVAKRAAAVVFILTGKRYYLNWFHRATGIKLTNQFIRETEDIVKNHKSPENRLKLTNVIENKTHKKCLPDNNYVNHNFLENLNTINTLEDTLKNHSIIAF